MCSSQQKQLTGICLLKKLNPFNSYTISSHPPSVLGRIACVWKASFPVFKDSEAEVYAQEIKLVNEVNDSTRFPPVEIKPWIKYIARWLAPWTAHWNLMKSVRDLLYDSHLDECDQTAKMGRGTGCYIEKVLDRQQEPGDISYLGATLMDAGAETSVSFLLALLSYPKYHKRIQNEINTVIGSGRMPNSPDYETLSILASFRQRALMHTSEDIPYEGYVIPKGSILFINTWILVHDPVLLSGAEPFDLVKNWYLEPGLEPAPKSFVCDVKVRDVKRAEMINASYSLSKYTR
ncbi:hypothetical protein BYT27DRAFT_7217810 [Phlegmacium glaucopus]|nr:hypothetical protein BYT27DRAFT_7217810 [Phlegmacium glaucopus]